MSPLYVVNDRLLISYNIFFSREAPKNQHCIFIKPLVKKGKDLFLSNYFFKRVYYYSFEKRRLHLKTTNDSIIARGKGFILEAVLTELSVLYFSIIVWFRKPNMRSEEVYTYHKSSQIKTIVIVFSILIIAEGVFFHFLIQRWSEVAAWILTVLNLYALMYMVGLYNSVRFLPHVMKQGKLFIRLGFQSSIEIDSENIESIRQAREIDFGEKRPQDTYYSLLQIDSPQFELILKEPILMKGSYGKKKYVNRVIFRADEPNKLMERLHSLAVIADLKKG